MGVLITVLVVFAVAGLILLAMSLRNVQQYEKGVVFRFGRLLPDIRGPGLRIIRPIGNRMADNTPGALQLRLLQTVVDVSAEKNSTLVMPFPVEMLRFFEHQSRETDGESTHRSIPRPALPELTTPGPPTTPTFSLRGEPVGSLSGERIGNRAAVAREQRDNWLTPADSDSGASHAHS